MMEDDKQKKTSKQTGRGPEFEALYKRLTSEKVKKASDALFAASEEDLKKAFKPESDQNNGGAWPGFCVTVIE